MGAGLIQRINAALRLPLRKETSRILLCFKDLQGKSAESIFKELRRKGELTVPFHFLIPRNGRSQQGRRLQEVGGRQEDPEGQSIVIFVDARGKQEMTSPQREAVETLGSLYALPIVIPGGDR